MSLRSLITACISACFLIAAGARNAQAEPRLELHPERWHSIGETPGSLVLQRKIDGQEAIGPVGTLTYTWIPGENPGKVAEDIRKAFGAPSWFQGKRGETRTYTAVLPEANRIVHFYLREKDGGTLLFLVSIRRLFALPVLVEADWIELALEKRGSQSASLRLLDWLVPEAQAATFTIPGNLNGVTIPANLPPITVSPSITLGPGVQNSINGLTNQLQGFQNLGNNGVNAINNGAAAVNNLSNSVQNGTGQVTNSLDNATSSINRATDTVNDVVSPKNMAKIAFAGAFGATAGVLALHALIDGSVSLVVSAYNWVTGTLPSDVRAKIIDRSSRAMQTLQSAARDESNLESAMDQRLLVLSMAAESNTSIEDLLTASTRVKRSSEKRYSRYYDAFKGVRDGSSDELACQNAMDREEKLQQDLSGLIGMMNNYRNFQARDVCNQVESDIQNWISTQASLRQARDALTSDMLLVMGLTAKQFNDAQDRLGTDRANENACSREVQSMVDESNRRMSSACANDSKSSSGDCAQIKQAYAAAQEALTICKSTSQQRVSFNDNSAFAKDIRLASAQITNLKNTYNKLLQADCRQGNSGGACQGDAGEFTKAEDRMRKRLIEAKRLCPASSLSAELLGSPEDPTPAPNLASQAQAVAQAVVQAQSLAQPVPQAAARPSVDVRPATSAPSSEPATPSPTPMPSPAKESSGGGFWSFLKSTFKPRPVDPFGDLYRGG